MSAFLSPVGESLSSDRIVSSITIPDAIEDEPHHNFIRASSTIANGVGTNTPVGTLDYYPSSITISGTSIGHCSQPTLTLNPNQTILVDSGERLSNYLERIRTLEDRMGRIQELEDELDKVKLVLNQVTSHLNYEPGKGKWFIDSKKEFEKCL